MQHAAILPLSDRPCSHVALSFGGNRWQFVANGERTLLLMTAAKSLKRAAKSFRRKDVERVTTALLGALKTECPSYSEEVLAFPPALPKAESKRGAVLRDAYRRAWAALVGFDRPAQAAAAKKRGQGVAFFDDRQTGLAIANLERARTLIRNAGLALEKHIAQIRKERARIGLLGDDVGHYPAHVDALRATVKGLDARLAKLKSFEDIPQARSLSEWDDFISEAAKNLLDVGFATREVAALLTGKEPEAVDRATLERFRQRVNRLEISKG